jgi:hypothetical protein
MARLKTLSAAFLASLVVLAPATPARAEVKVPASLVAELVILEEPSICHTTLHTIHLVGYGIAEEAYEVGYGEGKHPSAAAVFYSLVRKCRAMR